MRKKKTVKTGKIILNILLLFAFLVYLAVLTDLLLFRFRAPAGDYTRPTYSQYFRRQVNLTPLKTVRAYFNYGTVGFYNNAGNIAAFLPMGFFYGAFFRRRKNILRCALSIALVSLVFECLQMILLVGSFDVDDILLNALGGIVGFILLRILRGVFRFLF